MMTTRKLALYLLIGAVGIAMCVAAGYVGVQIVFFQEPTLSEVEEEIAIDLPDSATDLQYSHARFFELNVYLRFNLPPDDLPELLSQICQGEFALEDGFVSRYISSEASSNPSWFNPEPDAMTAYSGGDCRIITKQQLYTYSILIDESDDNLHEVFLSVIAE